MNKIKIELTFYFDQEETDLLKRHYGKYKDTIQKGMEMDLSDLFWEEHLKYIRQEELN